MHEPIALTVSNYVITLQDFFLIILFPVVIIGYGCSTYEKPDLDLQSLAFHDRVLKQEDDRLTISTSVLSDEEAHQVLGVDIGLRWIQIVWVQISNKTTNPFWLLFPSVDQNYFSPNEVAYSFHSVMSKSDYQKFADFLRTKSFSNPVYPGETRSGFIYVNRDEHAKELNFQLLSVEALEEFTFYYEIPDKLRVSSFAEIEGNYHEGDFQDIDESELRFALEYLPCCTTDKNGEGQGDPLNLIILGNQDDLFTVFVRSGWYPAEETYLSSIWKTMNSFIFGERYRYSPVSPLYVFGRSQDIALQKARGTVHQRNHMRLWLTPLRYDGKSIWIGQISRDIGVRFTLKSGTGVTHKIDPDIDESRNAIIQELAYSKGLQKLGFVKGVGKSTSDKPKRNLTDDPYVTDGFRGVLLMDRKLTPLNDLNFFHWEDPGEREFQIPMSEP